MFGVRRAVTVLASCLLVAGCSGTGASAGGATASVGAGASAASVSPRPSVGPSLPAGVTRRIDVGGMAYGIAGEEDSVWVETDSGMQQIDTTTGEVRQTVPGLFPTLVEDTLWLVDGNRVTGVDSATGEEVAAYEPPVIGGSAVYEGQLWAVSEATGTLSKVDLDRSEVLGELTLPSGEPKAVVYWEDAVWVVIDGSDVILRVDPDSLEVTLSIDGGLRPHSLAVAFGSLWVTEHGRDSLLRIGPSGEVEASIKGPGINVAIAVAGDSLWAATPYGVAQVDPETNQVVREIELGSGDWYAMAYAAGSLWLTSGESGFVYQIPV